MIRLVALLLLRGWSGATVGLVKGKQEQGDERGRLLTRNGQYLHLTVRFLVAKLGLRDR
jgi:hypothetical protein